MGPDASTGGSLQSPRTNPINNP
uniref:Uncharacterized protein MANES_S053400 n=1 Tax=Rhizophora mucronata TaxID=61149 RepID=A0A2P2PKN7_RHIMU